MIDVTYQANHKGTLGRGPHTIPSSGCVLCSTYMALVALHCIDPSAVSLGLFHTKCIDVGAFDDPGVEHDMLDVAKAVDPWKAKAIPHVSDALTGHLADVFMHGGVALIRVGFTPGGSNHTIMAHSYDALGNVLCCDPAIGHIKLRPDLTQEMLSWGSVNRSYYGLNIRPIYRKAA